MAQQIDTLTPEQEAKLPEYRDRWLKIGLSCEPCSFEAAKEAATRAYLVAGLTPPPEFVLVDSPKACVDAIRARGYDDALNAQIFGSHDAGWLSFYNFFLEEFQLEVCEKLRPLMDLAQHCGWWAPFDTVCFLQHRHSEVHLDEEGRLHNESDMAVRYRDGWGVYAWHGIRVKPHVISAPDTITVQEIDQEDNAEIKRLLMERFGFDRYIAEGTSREVHQDDFGVLYVKDVPGDEPLVMVKVANATAEPDGTFKDYFLRVPPHITSAREAVAWTFDKGPEEYLPEVET